MFFAHYFPGSLQHLNYKQHQCLSVSISSQQLSAILSNLCPLSIAQEGQHLLSAFSQELIILKNSAVNLPKAWKSTKLSSEFSLILQRKHMGSFYAFRTFYSIVNAKRVGFGTRSDQAGCKFKLQQSSSHLWQVA